MMNQDGTFKQDIQCIISQKNGIGAIFISNIQAASNPLTLKKYGIGAVITAIKGKNLSDKIPKHIQYLYIPVVDHQSCNISAFFKDSFEFIDSQRKRTNVLVHCMAGVSRSVTLVIAYIMQKSGSPFLTAYNYVKSKRSIIHPNQAFIQQLIEHEKKLNIKNDSNQTDKQQNKSSTGFRYNNRQKNSNLDKKHSNKFQSTCNSFNSNNFSHISTSKTDTQWYKKPKLQNSFGQKQNNIQQYDKRLRQNIKKLFSQTNSRITQFNKSQLMR